jgi:hypothetical protein
VEPLFLATFEDNEWETKETSLNVLLTYFKNDQKITAKIKEIFSLQ